MATSKKPVRRPARKAMPKTSHYEIDWVGDEYRPVTVDARSLTLPSLAIIGVVGAFVWGTYIIVGERNRLDTRIDAAVGAIERLADAVDRSVRASELKSAERYTQTDHSLFCAQAETINKGWKCPAYVRASGTVQLQSVEELARDLVGKALDRAKDARIK